MVLQTLPRHDLFSQGLWEEGSGGAFCSPSNINQRAISTPSTHGAPLSLRACDMEPGLLGVLRAPGSDRAGLCTRSGAPGLAGPEVWVASGHCRGCWRAGLGLGRIQSVQEGSGQGCPTEGFSGHPQTRRPGHGAHAGGGGPTPPGPQHVTPASDSSWSRRLRRQEARAWAQGLLNK